MANPVRYDEYFRYQSDRGMELSLPGKSLEGYKIPDYAGNNYGELRPVFVLRDIYTEPIIVGLKPVNPLPWLSKRVLTAILSHKDADAVFVESIDFVRDDFVNDLSPIRLLSMFFGDVPFDYHTPSKIFSLEEMDSENPLINLCDKWRNGEVSVYKGSGEVGVYGHDFNFEYRIKTATAKSGWACGSEETLIFAERNDRNITLIGSTNDLEVNGYAQVRGLMMLLEPDALLKRED